MFLQLMKYFLLETRTLILLDCESTQATATYYYLKTFTGVTFSSGRQIISSLTDYFYKIYNLSYAGVKRLGKSLFT